MLQVVCAGIHLFSLQIQNSLWLYPSLEEIEVMCCTVDGCSNVTMQLCSKQLLLTIESDRFRGRGMDSNGLAIRMCTNWKRDSSMSVSKYIRILEETWKCFYLHTYLLLPNAHVSSAECKVYQMLLLIAHWSLWINTTGPERESWVMSDESWVMLHNSYLGSLLTIIMFFLGCLYY